MLVESELNRFRKTVVKEAKTSLTKQKINVTKETYNSIKSDLKVSKNSFELSFYMKPSGKFIDKGVQGKKSNKKAPKSPFKYTNKRPPSQVFDKWSVRRGIAKRNEKGQFTSRKSQNFAIANAVYNYGIKTTNFFTKPFESAFKKLPDDLVKSYGLEVDKLLTNTLK